MSPFQGLRDKPASIPVALPQAILLRPFGAFMNFSNCLERWERSVA
jgi:hypothetical protein